MQIEWKLYNSQTRSSRSNPGWVIRNRDDELQLASSQTASLSLSGIFVPFSTHTHTVAYTRSHLAQQLTHSVLNLQCDSVFRFKKSIFYGRNKIKENNNSLNVLVTLKINL